MELGKKIMIFSTVAILATGGYQLVKNSNPYNNKQISFISWVPTAFSIVSQLRTFSFIKPQYLKKAFFLNGE